MDFLEYGWILMLITLAPGWLVITLLFGLGYLLSERYQNAGIADVCWGWGLPLATLTSVIWSIMLVQAIPDPTNATALPLFGLREMVLLAIMGLGYGRLGWHITRRFIKQWPTEDPRYNALRQVWAPHAHWYMLGVFALQAGFMWILLLPVGFVLLRMEPFLLTGEWVSVALACLAIVGETMADEQLRQFQSNPANKGQICKVGLWYTSRHPNYFFQWLFWVAMASWATVAVPFMGWVSWSAPALMLHFLLNVTGVKPTEEGMLKSRGDAYRAYQKTTSAFVPWFPKRS
jgi:steroid 5-alpha reductase family enzyme